MKDGSRRWAAMSQGSTISATMDRPINGRRLPHHAIARFKFSLGCQCGPNSRSAKTIIVENRTARTYGPLVSKARPIQSQKLSAGATWHGLPARDSLLVETDTGW